MFRLSIFIAAVNSLVLASAAADDSFYGTYSGECTLNGERMRIELEIVKNEGTQMGGDALLTLSKKDGTSPPIRITMIGGYRHVREVRRRGDPSIPKATTEFNYRTIDASETLGMLAVQLTQDGSQLKGTLSMQPTQSAHPASVPIVLTPSSMTNSESPPTASRESPSQLTPEEITGLYEGTLTSNKRQFFARLRLNRERENDLSGLLDFFATASDPRPLGSFKLTGKFDAPNNRFQLSSGGELTSSDGLILATANGNFEPANGRIRAQLIPNDGTLELTRNREKTAELQAKSAEDIKRLSQGPVSLAEAKTEQGRRDAIVRWFSRLKTEYPDIDLHHTVLNLVLPKVLNLFGDDAFVPVFGKPFDEMTADDRNYVKLMFRRLFTGPQTRNLLDGFGDFLERPFVLPHGSFSYADVAPQVAFRRSVYKKWNETMTRLKALPATSAGFDEIHSLKEQGEKAFPDLWPSQLRQFREAVGATRHRVAEGALVERLNAALVQAAGYDGIIKLKQIVDTNTELLGLVPETVQKRELARVQERYEIELKPLMETEGHQIDTLGSGAAALANGTEWLRNFRRRYEAHFRLSPVISETHKHFEQRRLGDLEAGEKEVVALISGAPNSEAVKNIMAKYLGVDNDQATSSGTRIAQAAEARLRAIAWEEEKKKYSERELGLMSAPGVVAVPANYPPPTSEEIRLATLRAYAALDGRVLSAHVATFAPIRPYKKFAYRVTIDHVDGADAAHPCQRLSDGSYQCEFRPTLKIDLPDFGGATDIPAIKVWNEVVQRAQKPEAKPWEIATFILTPKGWRSPDQEASAAALSIDLPQLRW